MALIAILSIARSILRGRPPWRPLASATASPARVRSAMSSRSNSANAAKIAKWRGLEAGEFATLEWVDWFNHRRVLEPIGDRRPAEAEAAYYRQIEHTALAA